MGLQEIVVAVDHLDDALRIYRDRLGLSVLATGAVGAEVHRALGSGERDTPVAIVGRPDVPGSPRLRLIDSGGGREAAPADGGTAAAAGTGRTARATGDTRSCGPLGIGFTTRGIDAVHAAVGAAGVRFLSAPVKLTPDAEGPTGPQRFEAFGQAPNGEFIVLIDRRNVPTPYGALAPDKPVSEPLHSSWIVGDQAHCGRFMARVLGHRLLFREECEGEEFERLMGVEAGTRFWFSMLGHPDHPTGRIIFIEYEGQGIEPPRDFDRGIVGLAYSCRDLEATLARAAALGVSFQSAATEIDHPVLGRGRVAVLRPPWGSRLELWERS